MRELSVFADESGDAAGISKYYIICLVFHEQLNTINEIASVYESSLMAANLPNIPFHSEPLLNGRLQYDLLSIKERKKMLNAFASLVRYLPIQYAIFSYKRSELKSQAELSLKIQNDISNFILEHLTFFQTFDKVKLYYDNGQDIVKQAMFDSFNFALSKGVVYRRKTSMTEYRLEQVADYLCTIELAAIKYSAHEDGATYNKFFGGIGSFKKNWLKQARRKLIRV